MYNTEQNEYRLRLNAFFGEDDYDHLEYFEIIDRNGDLVWESYWFNPRRDFQTNGFIAYLRYDLQHACDIYRVDCDLSSDNHLDWAEFQ